jgi:hypothetical protein
MAEFADSIANDLEAFKINTEDNELNLSEHIEQENPEAKGSLEAEDEESEGEEDVTAEGGKDTTGKKKKRKKKKQAKKKVAKSTTDGVTGVVFANAGTPSIMPVSRQLGGFADYYVKYGQTYPPTKPVKELFPRGNFPVGEILEHNKTRYPDPNSSWTRQSEEEKRYASNQTLSIIQI